MYSIVLEKIAILMQFSNIKRVQIEKEEEKISMAFISAILDLVFFLSVLYKEGQREKEHE